MISKELIQSFSSAVHPLCRLTDSQVALFFRTEDGRTALPGSAKRSRSYPGVDSKGTYRNGERLYSLASQAPEHHALRVPPPAVCGPAAMPRKRISRPFPISIPTHIPFPAAERFPGRSWCLCVCQKCRDRTPALLMLP